MFLLRQIMRLLYQLIINTMRILFLLLATRIIRHNFKHKHFKL